DIEEYFDYDDEDANKRASSSGNDSNIGVEVETSVRDLESGALLYMTYWNFDFYTS
ncbi:unnamed protein product, partial [Brassica oleracea]